MKRNIIVGKLIKEGFSEKTLVKFTDKQLLELSKRILSEEATNQPQVTANVNDPNFNQVMTKLKQSGVQNINVTEEDDKKEEDLGESLHGIMIGAIKDRLTKDLGREPKDHEIEREHNKFMDSWKKDNEKKQKGEKEPTKKKKDVDELLRFYDDDGNPIKNKKGEHDAVSTKSKDFKKKTKSKKCSDCGEDAKDCKCDHSHLDENRTIKNWVKTLAEENFHSFTSKNEIMELINYKLNESEVSEPKVPEFMSYSSIKSSGPATAPTKPKTSPGTKPGTSPGKPKPRTPYEPGIGPKHKPKAGYGIKEEDVMDDEEMKSKSKVA